jgi:hypothetical protein
MAYMSPVPIGGWQPRQPQFNAAAGYQGQQPPQPNWWTGTDPIRNVGVPTKPYYTNQDPRAFWGQIGQQVAGGNSVFENYWNQNFDKYHQQFLQSAEGQENMNNQFPDWVTGNVAGKVQQGFLLQDARQRGIDSRLYDKGRFDTSY